MTSYTKARPHRKSRDDRENNVCGAVVKILYRDAKSVVGDSREPAVRRFVTEVMAIPDINLAEVYEATECLNNIKCKPWMDRRELEIIVASAFLRQRQYERVFS